MTGMRAIALICWFLWAALLAAGLEGTLPWPLAVAIAGSIYLLWRIWRRHVLSGRLR